MAFTPLLGSTCADSFYCSDSQSGFESTQRNNEVYTFIGRFIETKNEENLKWPSKKENQSVKSLVGH